MNDGSAFPERDLIILIAGGAIVISLLITNFILPLCVRKKTKTDKSAENEAYLEILQNVIAELKEHTTPENKTATAFVISNYHDRRVELQHKHKFIIVDREEERKLKMTICKWEIENINEMLERGEVDRDIAQFCLDRLGGSKSKHKYKRTISRAKIFELMETNAQFVIEKLNQISKTDDSPVIQKAITDREIMLSIYQRHSPQNKTNDESLAAVALHGFQIERDNIQAMLEAGRISRETAKEMRHNISLMEVQLKKDYF